MAIKHKDFTAPIDFFARRPHYLDHLAQIWNALHLERRGVFYVPEILLEYAVGQGIPASALTPRAANRPMSVGPGGSGPLLICAYGDLEKARFIQPRRPFFFMEHGIGFTFNNPGYAGGLQLRRHVDLFLNPNEHTQRLNARAVPQAVQEVIGTPKLDEWAEEFEKDHTIIDRKPVVAISFHWDGSRIAREAGNAFEHYKGQLAELARQKDFKLIGHAHPRIIDSLAPVYEAAGIEVVRDFRDVMKMADLYVNDCSSTLYEFCVTGKPVIILNAPWFKRSVQRGIRFWEYADIGPQVDQPAQLLPAIERVLTGPDEWIEQRRKAVQDLYPHLGRSAERSLEAIGKFVSSRQRQRTQIRHRTFVKRELRSVREVQGESIGLVYMAFGAPAAVQVMRSTASMHRLGLDVPVVVVGDMPVKGAQFIQWVGQSPFDPAERRNFQFRAGRIKPLLITLTPFQRTLYIDADTEFMSTDFLHGFELLDDHDLALAQELLSIGQLYNKPRAGWEVNIIERDATIQELGGDPKAQFLNSGVIFFRKKQAVLDLFCEWFNQWMRWQQWDEQLSLVRAIHKCKPNYQVLSVDWNHPHRTKAKIIFHNYGRGNARINVK